MQIKVKKLHIDAILPKHARTGDVGMDLYSIETVTIAPQTHAQVRTGVAFEIPLGYAGLIWDKSSVAQKGGLKTMGGVIDSGYRGEILVGLANLSNKSYTFEKGHKVAQMLIQKVEQSEIVDVDELSDSERGTGAFGSTGK